MRCYKDEYDLLNALSKGDETAFKCIYDDYSEKIFSNILRMVKSQSLAQELLQEIFIKLWDKRHLINPQKSFSAYLSRIAENTVFDFFRKAARDKALKKELLLTSSQLYFHIEENIYARENIHLIQSAIDALPPQRKKIFQLCKIEGLSYEEISQALNISVSTISDHIVKANHFIRDYLNKKPELSLSLLLIYLLH